MLSTFISRITSSHSGCIGERGEGKQGTKMFRRIKNVC